MNMFPVVYRTIDIPPDHSWHTSLSLGGLLLVGQHGRIDRKFVLGRNRIQQKEIVRQKEKCPVSYGLMCWGKNEEKTMNRDLGSDYGSGPKEKPERGISGRRVREEEG
jgi:hypothetical protein